MIKCKVCGEEFEKLHSRGKCRKCYVKYRYNLPGVKQKEAKNRRRYTQSPRGKQIIKRRDLKSRIARFEKKYLPEVRPRIIELQIQHMKQEYLELIG